MLHRQTADGLQKRKKRCSHLSFYSQLSALLNPGPPCRLRRCAGPRYVGYSHYSYGCSHLLRVVAVAGGGAGREDERSIHNVTRKVSRRATVYILFSSLAGDGTNQLPVDESRPVNYTRRSLRFCAAPACCRPHARLRAAPAGQPMRWTVSRKVVMLRIEDWPLACASCMAIMMFIVVIVFVL